MYMYTRISKAGFFVYIRLNMCFVFVPGIITLSSTVKNIVSITIALDKTVVFTKLAWTHNIQLKIQLKIIVIIVISLNHTALFSEDRL